MFRKHLKRINKEHQDKVCVYYAMKANRFQNVMKLIRDENDIGKQGIGKLRKYLTCTFFSR